MTLQGDLEVYQRMLFNRPIKNDSPQDVGAPLRKARQKADDNLRGQRSTSPAKPRDIRRISQKVSDRWDVGGYDLCAARESFLFILRRR